jgi:hypothetical protein
MIESIGSKSLKNAKAPPFTFAAAVGSLWRRARARSLGFHAEAAAMARCPAVSYRAAPKQLEAVMLGLRSSALVAASGR